MPYIKQADRLGLLYDENPIPSDAGELNFMLTQLCITYLEHQGKRYQTMNDIMGALEGCKLEFYRRLVGPYEDLKIKENGDVYPTELKSEGY